MNLPNTKISVSALGSLITFVIASMGLATVVHAQQSFCATVDGTLWESDNAGIN